MRERPTFPARLDLSLGQARTQKTALTGVLPQGLGLDSGAVRMNMVGKLVNQGLTDPLVIAAMKNIERHRFVDSALVNQAYKDTSLPIGLGQTISKPSVVARMLELLRHGTAGKHTGLGDGLS
jgi:protein-L-isoaspartate(D-aspartate) O-methyltransferase